MNMKKIRAFEYNGPKRIRLNDIVMDEIPRSKGEAMNCEICKSAINAATDWTKEQI